MSCLFLRERAGLEGRESRGWEKGESLLDSIKVAGTEPYFKKKKTDCK